MKNAHLWKRILNEGIADAPRSSTKDDAAQQRIITAPIIVSPPVEKIEATWQDLCGIAVPFPSFWIEGEATSGTDLLRWGCLIDSKVEDFGFSARAACCYATTSIPPEIIGRIGFTLDKSGTPIKDTFEFERPPGWITDGVGLENAKSWIAFPALAACLALMILGCKNVSLHPSPIEPGQTRRAIKRFGGDADSYRYHVLLVRPAGSKTGTKGQEIGVMPHHVCRGHFAEYGPEFNKGLLFGKYAGRFYVPPCVKGKKERGIVEKDYSLPSPPAPAPVAPLESEARP